MSETLILCRRSQISGSQAADNTGTVPSHPLEPVSTTARLLPADGPFAALDLPPGAHRVTLTYREPLFAWGGALSLLALAGIAILFRR